MPNTTLAGWVDRMKRSTNQLTIPFDLFEQTNWPLIMYTSIEEPLDARKVPTCNSRSFLQCTLVIDPSIVRTNVTIVQINSVVTETKEGGSTIKFDSNSYIVTSPPECPVGYGASNLFYYNDAQYRCNLSTGKVEVWTCKTLSSSQQCTIDNADYIVSSNQVPDCYTQVSDCEITIPTEVREIDVLLFDSTTTRQLKGGDVIVVPAYNTWTFGVPSCTDNLPFQCSVYWNITSYDCPHQYTPCSITIHDHVRNTTDLKESILINGICICPVPFILDTDGEARRCKCPQGQRYNSTTGQCSSTCSYYIVDPDPYEEYVTPMIPSVVNDTDGTCACGSEFEVDHIDPVPVPDNNNNRVASSSRCICLGYADLDRRTNRCIPHRCEILFKTTANQVTVTYDRYPSTPTTYTTANAFVDSRSSGVISNYCPLDNTQPPITYLNDRFRFNCNKSDQTIQVPACVNTCPSSYQFWNGQECECYELYKDRCHTCGPLGNCNGRGTCIKSARNTGNSFCSCTDNHGGKYCEVPPTNNRCSTSGDMRTCRLAYDNTQCDCGVTWSIVNFQQQVRFQVISHALHTSYIHMDAIIYPSSTVVVPRLILNQRQGWIGAAKKACYDDPDCEGITWLTSTKEFTPIKFIYNTPFITPSWIRNDQLSSLQIHKIDRHSSYNCSSLEPNYFWYYFHSGYRAEIEAHFACSGCCAAPGACSLTSVPFLQLQSDNWYKWAVDHWREMGIRRRYQPNPTCILAPTKRDPITRCSTARPGCEQLNEATSEPCSGNGYCVQSSLSSRDQHPYRCACKPYTSQDVQGEEFSAIPKYMGYACQYETATFCTTPGRNNATNFCNGQEYRCQPLLVPDSPLLSGTIDHIPGCNCNRFTSVFTSKSYSASSYIGSYCTESRCNDANNCNNKGDGLSTCIEQEADRWKCACGYTSTGDKCQYDTHNCMNPYNPTLRQTCSGHGVCKPPGSPFSSNPNYKIDSEWCLCNTGYDGAYCYDSSCSIQTLVPGHGECNNGNLLSCYPVYSGVACANPICESSGGTTINSTHCECLKSNGLTYNLGVDNGTDPSCWPRCPEDDKTGQICGDSLINSCIMTKSQLGTKSATCQCNSLSGWLPFNTSCYKFCSDYGRLDPNWTPTNPLPCICDPSSGMISSITHPRCDIDRCAPNGKWNLTQCECDLLYYGDSCQYNRCDNPNTVDVTEGYPTGPICICNTNYLPTDTYRRQDCALSICGSQGSLAPLYNPITNPTGYAEGVSPIKDKCICDGIFTTATCKSEFDCTPYCSSSYCDNGGYPYNTSSSVCMCPFPFISMQPNGYCSYSRCGAELKIGGKCQTHQCGLNGVPGIGVCLCYNGWKSYTNKTNSQGLCTEAPCCNVSPCRNGGVWNQDRLKCDCPIGSGTSGDYCDVLSNITPTTPTPLLNCTEYGQLINGNTCVCSYYWSGSRCENSPCGLKGVFNSITLKCDCIVGFKGIFCEQSSSTSTPTSVPTSPPTSFPTPPSPTHSVASFRNDRVEYVVVVLVVLVSHSILQLLKMF